MSNSISKDLMFCILAGLASIVVLIASFAYQPTSSYFPQILAGFICILAVLLGLQSVKRPVEPTSDVQKTELRGFVKVLVSVLGYTGAMLIIGFPIATALFLVAMMLFLGERRPVVILPVALGLTGLLVFLFIWFLGVYPPEALISFS